MHHFPVFIFGLSVETLNVKCTFFHKRELSILIVETSENCTNNIWRIARYKEFPLRPFECTCSWYVILQKWSFQHLYSTSDKNVHFYESAFFMSTFQVDAEIPLEKCTFQKSWKVHFSLLTHLNLMQAEMFSLVSFSFLYIFLNSF